VIKSIAAGAAILAVASAASAAGSTVAVSYDAYVLVGHPAYEGTFTGTDTNNDGTISFSELTSFAGTSDNTDPNLNLTNGEYLTLSLSDLSGFGDYTLATNTWHNNGYVNEAYGYTGFFTFGNYSLADFDQASVTTTLDSVTAPVPEPSQLALMSVGATLLLLLRRQRRS
jgi:hypothetical protein